MTTDAPERIFVHYETETDDAKWSEWDYTDAFTGFSHYGEYIRADLAKPTVKPLEWHEGPQYETDEYGCDSWGEFSYEKIVATCKTQYLAVYQHSENKYMWVDETLDNIRYSTYRKFPFLEKVEIPWYPTVKEAKEAAQADYEKRILSALEDTWTP